jgi:hypothetical protein
MMKVILKNHNITDKFLIVDINRDFPSIWVDETSNYFQEICSNKILFQDTMVYYNNY